MTITSQLAKHLKEVYSGGNWTDVNLKNTLQHIDWKQATTKIYSFNTIAALVYHINYYVTAIIKVFEDQPLDSSDKYSFALDPITSQENWQKLLDKTFSEAEKFAGLIEELPESKLSEVFVNDKYGSYLRNILGVIEHTHYHLGQIVLIKKIILENSQES